MSAARHLRVLYVALTGVIVLADQFVKHLVDHTLVLHESRQVIPGLIQLTYVRNRGGAFGLLSSADLPMHNVFFATLSVLAFGIILVVALRLPAQRGWVQLPLSLVMGGALGNLIDRVRYGYVIDFVDVYWGTHHWPMFNVADSAISVGVGLLLLDTLREPRRPAQEPQAGIEPDQVARRN